MPWIELNYPVSMRHLPLQTRNKAVEIANALLAAQVGIAGSTVFLNYALWESVAHFRAAFTHPDFQSALEQYPSSAVASPHLFTRLAVPNLCVGP